MAAPRRSLHHRIQGLVERCNSSYPSLPSSLPAPLSPPDPELLGSIASLSVALHERNAYTGQHCDRVCMLALQLGKACALPEAELGYLQTAATFHDIGKIGVPDQVLLKPGPLDHEEWTLMSAHSEQGERIFVATGRADATVVANVIRHHHEAFDGSGYPDGLKGEQIPLLARILSLADSYDAMGSLRPYQRRKRHAEIMSILHAEQGRKSDPQLFRAFAAMIERSDARIP